MQSQWNSISIYTGDSWMTPAKYFEAFHSIIMTNIFLAKQVPTLGPAGLVPGD